MSPPLSQDRRCTPYVGQALEVDFLIIRSGQSDEFDFDTADKFRIVKLEYQLLIVPKSLRVAPGVVAKTLNQKLLQKLQHAIFVWDRDPRSNDLDRHFGQKRKVQIYRTPFDPNPIKVASLLAAWIEAALGKKRLTGFHVSSVALTDQQGGQGTIDCDSDAHRRYQQQFFQPMMNGNGQGPSSNHSSSPSSLFQQEQVEGGIFDEGLSPGFYDFPPFCHQK